MIIHEMQQQTNEWFAVRLGKITASCFAIATAKGRDGGPSSPRAELITDLVTERITRKPRKSKQTPSMKRGTEIEQEAREYYEALNGVEVRQVGFIERDEDIGCSPDGLVGDKGMLEIKCPDSKTHIRYIREKRLPTAYVKQVQGNLWVAERDWIDFMSFDPRVSQRVSFIVRVYRDEAVIKELHIGLVMFLNALTEELAETIALLSDKPF